ncbi:MAG TPA: hypothetical protein VFQ89_08845, partial [Candidatus Binatia bacterium]|nr:hypothetical protein [Candidatus Binatia bacterium]
SISGELTHVAVGTIQQMKMVCAAFKATTLPFDFAQGGESCRITPWRDKFPNSTLSAPRKCLRTAQVKGRVFCNIDIPVR